MAIDMSQFYQVFFDESAEHLASMESLLLSMNLEAPDGESLNAIFRAAHSIKGSSATFGFNDMAALTHVMETMLDLVRKGEALLDAELVDACLAAGDVLRNQLAAHRGEGQADPEAAAAMRARLERLSRAMSAGAPRTPAGSDAVAMLRVSFLPDAGARNKPALIDNLLAELASFGRVLECAPGQGETPWQIRFETAAAADNLRAIIEFVAEPASVHIVPIGADGVEGPPHRAGPQRAWLDDDEDGAFGFFTNLPPAMPDARIAEPQLAYSANKDAGVQGAADGGKGSFGPVGAAALSPCAEPLATQPQIAAQPAVAGAASAQAGSKVGGDGNSIRVGVDRIDQLLNLVGELVISQSMLSEAAALLGPQGSEQLLSGLAQLERNTRDLQESVMAIRMLPISTVFSRFPRVVRDLSQKLGKQVELKLFGEHTELDRSLVERLTDPLTHLVRNSLDHGIESPQQRESLGKRAVGTVTLKAFQQAGNVVIEVGDDGAGLNRERIVAKARQRGMTVPDSMSDAEVWMLIFEAGFSTAEVVTEVSGRGVGMDVVKRNIAALGGRIEIESMAGIGTRTTVRVPLTLAILEGISVAVGRESYILPLGCVVESLQPTGAMIRSIGGRERLLRLRGEYLPVATLRDVFGIAQPCSQWWDGIMVIIEADGARAALFVDALVGQHQVVVKSLEANYRRVEGVSGATIMGDGRVALILDAGALVSLARRSVPAAA